MLPRCSGKLSDWWKSSRYGQAEMTQRRIRRSEDVDRVDLTCVRNPTDGTAARVSWFSRNFC